MGQPSSDNAMLNMRNVYPLARGKTIGETATQGAANPATPENKSTGSAELDYAMRMAGAVNPVYGFIVLAIMLFILMFGAKRLGEGSGASFANIGPTFTNALFIGLGAVTTIPILKWLVLKVHIPGVTPWVLSA